jgi:hypothetical protein
MVVNMAFGNNTLKPVAALGRRTFLSTVGRFAAVVVGGLGLVVSLTPLAAEQGQAGPRLFRAPAIGPLGTESCIGGVSCSPYGQAGPCNSGSCTNGC